MTYEESEELAAGIVDALLAHDVGTPETRRMAVDLIAATLRRVHLRGIEAGRKQMHVLTTRPKQQ